MIEDLAQMLALGSAGLGLVAAALALRRGRRAKAAEDALEGSLRESERRSALRHRTDEDERRASDLRFESLVSSLESERHRLATAVDASHIGCFEFDPETGAISADERCLGHFGLPGDFEFNDRELLKRIHPDDRERIRAKIGEAVRSSTEYSVDHRVHWPDGTEHWVRARGRWETPADRPRRMLGVTLEATAEYGVGEERVRRQQWLEEVVNRLPVPILFIEPGTAKILYANEAAHAFTGGEFPMAGGIEEYERFYHVCDPSGRRLEAEEIGGARVARGERLDGVEIDWHLPAGKRTILLWGDTVPAILGQPATAMLLFQDIGRLKEAEAELRRANTAKDEFLAMLGHELRNPLGAVRNAVVAARLDEAHRERALEIARRQTERLGRLVDDLLDVARITQGKITLRKERLHLGNVVERAVESARPLIEERGHVFSVSFPAKAIRLEADASRLEQIIDNLLTNAAKYTPPGGRIELSAGREGEEAVIRVMDTGAGIAPDMLKHVFDLFAQGERPLDRSQGGLGIGLTIVRRLVEMHGGRVEAKSEGPGRGTEITVSLPALREAEEKEVAPVASAGDAARARVLVVEDNADAAESLKLLLELLGHEVRAVEDGYAALDLARTETFDVMLVDIGLPGMDGYEVARQMRPLVDRAKTLLVALTGYGRAEDKDHALAAGFDAHLTKPVDLDALQGVVARVVAVDPTTRAMLH